jgi:hypothetical protein
MTQVWDFVADLARAKKGFLEIKKTVYTGYGDKALKKTAIYAILKKAIAGKNTDDQHHLNLKKMVTTTSLIAFVATVVEKDRRQCIQVLAAAYGVSIYTIHSILHNNLGLEKKSTRCVPKFLSAEQKEERIRTCIAFFGTIQRQSMAMLDKIVKMDEMIVCHHTPEIKNQSM